ncbi:hypothetical protein [Oscillibacter sp.]|nr:hypothetical protein [Oscillibacter sp.]
MWRRGGKKDREAISKTMTDGCESWWSVGFAGVSERESTRRA